MLISKLFIYYHGEYSRIEESSELALSEVLAVVESIIIEHNLLELLIFICLHRTTVVGGVEIIYVIRDGGLCRLEVS
jgi:hypothetical protein